MTPDKLLNHMIEDIEISQALSLSPIKREDAASIFALIEKNRGHLREWLPWLDFSTSLEDSEAFIERSLQQATETSGQVMTIRYRNSTCGIIGFNSIDALHRICEIGYWVDADHQRLGIMTTSTKALIDFAFTSLGMNKVCIPVAEQNTRSRAIPERLGFKIEGVARDAEWLYDHYVDHVLYATLRSEWGSNDG